MYCNKCGNKLKEGASFCGKCGSTIKAKDEIIYKEEKKVEPIISTPIIVALVLGFLVISISLVGVLSFFTNSMEVI